MYEVTEKSGKQTQFEHKKGLGLDSPKQCWVWVNNCHSGKCSHLGPWSWLCHPSPKFAHLLHIEVKTSSYPQGALPCIGERTWDPGKYEAVYDELW